MTRRRVTDEQYGLAHRRLNEIARRLDEGTLPFNKVMDALQEVVEGYFDEKFPVWKTVKLGTFKGVKSLKQALKENGFQIGNWASDILNQRAFKLAKKETEVNLVVLSVAELGFPKGATYGEICDRARELGLDLCPAEVGPQIRLQYPDQPRGEWLTVAMEPITDSDGDPHVFNVDHDHDVRWLSAKWSAPGSFWSADDRFVVVSK